MATHKSKNRLLNEWKKLDKDWYSIYNWHSLSRKTYSEYIASIIIKYFPKIKLLTKGLRTKSFLLNEHRGQSNLNTSIKQFTEPRFCRALFNLGRAKFLNKIIAYEVPLKEKRNAKHGKIDLISYNKQNLFVIEAKSYKSNESILKALLETYVYSNLLSIINYSFFEECNQTINGIIGKPKLTPAILTFENATSGKQLQNINSYPFIKELIALLNKYLAGKGINNIRSFIITNNEQSIKCSLAAKPFDNKSKLVIFKQDFHPHIREIEIL